jgi:D-alanyl-D-alanine carboxypeptidase
MDNTILDAVTQKLQNRIPQLMAQHGLPGLVVGIVNDQQLVWTAGFGFADVETERRPDEHTLFCIGSITKTFTGTAIMQLCEAGQLHLDDPLMRYLPEFAAVRNRFGSVEEITLRQLLTHQAGLVSEAPLSYWETLTFPSLEQILATLPQVEVVIEPDSTFKYSNLAYVLLGEVVARLSQRSYTDYVQTEILEPLGMTSTVFTLTDVLRPRTATGYNPHPYEDAPTPAEQPHLNGLVAVGQLFSSSHDLS